MCDLSLERSIIKSHNLWPKSEKVNLSIFNCYSKNETDSWKEWKVSRHSSFETYWLTVSIKGNRFLLIFLSITFHFINICPFEWRNGVKN